LVLQKMRLIFLVAIICLSIALVFGQDGAKEGSKVSSKPTPSGASKPLACNPIIGCPRPLICCRLDPARPICVTPDTPC